MQDACLFWEKNFKLKCTQVQQLHVQPLRVFRKMASFKEIKDLNLFSYNIGIINDDVFFSPVSVLHLPEPRFAYCNCVRSTQIIFLGVLWFNFFLQFSTAFFFERLHFLRHFE